MMVTAQVVGNDATIAWANALGSNFDLNVMMPVIAYNLLQSIDLLANAAEHLADKCVDAERFLAGSNPVGVLRIEADVEGCRHQIERSLAMCTALAPRIGYDNASAIAKKAYQDKANVREIALGLVGKTPRRGRSSRSAVRPRPTPSRRKGTTPQPRRSRPCSTPAARPCEGRGSEARAAGDLSHPPRLGPG